MIKKPVRRRVRPEAYCLPLPAPRETELATLRNSTRAAEVSVDSLHPPARDVRRRTKRLMAAEKAITEQLGRPLPIMATTDGTIITGVTSWMTAKDLGHQTVTVFYVAGMTEAQAQAVRIYAHKKVHLGEWDNDALRDYFLELGNLSLDLRFQLDLELTGFTTKEIDDLTLPRSSKDGGGSVDDEEMEEDLAPSEGPAVTQLGDIWIIGGRHKIICGNSLEEETYAQLMGDELAQMVISDGPYGVKIKGNVSSRKDAQEFRYASGEMSFEEFIAFERPVMQYLCRFSIDGSIHYHFISWHFLCELLQAGRAEYDEHKNLLVWVKSNASRGFYRSQHELIAVFKHGKAPHICTFGIEKSARWRSNVIHQAGCNSFGSTRDEDLADHVTVKPTSLLADLMRDCSRRGGVILDPFGGSGATILAAHWTGRRARLIELEPRYVDLTVRRAARRFGLTAVLEATGQPFEEVARERLGNVVGDEEDPRGPQGGDAGDDEDDGGPVECWRVPGRGDDAELAGERTND